MDVKDKGMKKAKGLMNERQQYILGGLSKFQVLRLTTKLLKAYKKLCPSCQKNLFMKVQGEGFKGNIPMELFCVECQDILQPILEKFAAKVKK